MEKRKFLSSWKTEFLWFVYDSAHGIQCKYCVDAGKKNTFTKDCDKLKKDTLILSKHATIVDHRASIEVRSGRRDTQQA